MGIDNKSRYAVLASFVFGLTVSSLSFPAEPIKVTALNFVRAESDFQMATYAKRAGGLGKFVHFRDPYPVDAEGQPTIRGNRDTLYSFLVADLTAPLTIHKPETQGRYQSLMMVSQDHSALDTIHDSGSFTVTQEMMGTRYAWILVRTFMDASDPADIAVARRLQDALAVEQTQPGVLELPAWDQTSRVEMRDALNKVALKTITNFNGYFGKKEELDPIKHLLGAAYGWGGSPEKGAMYAQWSPQHNDGSTPYILNIPADVPVDAFWSVSVYNKDGFYERNPYGAYSLNSVTAAPNDDGSFTIHFGGDPEASNFLPIMEGWNYTVRMYQPHQQLIDGEWVFPEPEIRR